jgi:ABC transporter DrrB family efflux protein
VTTATALEQRTSTAAAPSFVPLTRAQRAHFAVTDAMTMTWRNLVTLRRVPQLLVFATVQPVLLLLLFRYVFGGAIRVPGENYVNYLMAGIFAQAATFGAISTGLGLNEDKNKGLIERLRSLPMARSAVLTGRTIADLIRNTLVVALLIGIGFAVGFTLETNVPKLLLATALILFFGFAVSWIFALIGLSAATAESAQAAMFPLTMPLVFASSAFVSTETMPDWLRGFAANQPLSKLCDAVRALLMGGPWGSDTLASVAWSAGIIAVFAPFAVMRYRKG